jgi:site-specific DNA recombinase
VNRSKSVRTTEFWPRRGKRKYYQGSKPTWRIAYAVARAHRWFDEISTGKARSLAEIAACEGLAVRYVGRLIRLGLAPVIIESIVEGRQPISLTAEALTRHIELPLEWRSQKAALNTR